MHNEIGFPGFQKEMLQTHEPLFAAARSFLQIGQKMMTVPVSGQHVVKQITQMVANSMESVLLLLSNGCGIDGLRIARTMFEAAVAINYLDRHQELVHDFVDYRWVIQKKHYDYLRTQPSDKIQSLAPEKIAEMESNYERVKGRFTDRKGRMRNSWCKANLREMAKEINKESMYGGLYPFGSSMTHTDILAVEAGADGTDDVEPVPSTANVMFTLQFAVMSFAMALTAFDKLAVLGRGDELEAAFDEFKRHC